MTHIPMPDDSEVSDETAQLYRDERTRVGYLPNFTRVFAGRPAVYRGWMALNGAVKASSDPRVYELATVAAAARLGSSYCVLAHGKVLAEQHFPAEVVADLVRDPASADITAADREVMRLADRVAHDAAGMTPADLQPLRDAGFSDDQIFDVILSAAVRCFFSNVLEAVGAEPDAAYLDLDPALRDALSVGRPIGSAAATEGT
ncbi:carboxymuconolactone decarboxylase family protein [Glaciibacter sp. 2TAF33]|uniref:carboxymuconolactone decarboxylase family protein n=1 Tax=Glaciibacter sp. 2TAF33 TaxID=3233015 RepID=UPI003F90BFA9